ncbi:MAG: 3-dehydroquinate synthase II [Syntrophobacterales bacterium]|nr:3-dehydroquinate synthase II [Syntrophobacterales bacterium]
MKKLLWVLVDKWDREFVTSAIELGVDGIVCPEEIAPLIKKLGRVTVISPKGDMVPGRDVHFERLKTPEDMQRIATLLRHSVVCIEDTDWNIIASENLVAIGGTLLLEVSGVEEAKLALTILERGVSGVLIRTEDSGLLRDIVSISRGYVEAFPMEEAVLTSIKPIGLGDRVCVDMALMLKEGEGLLVGDRSSFLFLVHGETLENPYANPRPFRVNAGGVHAYTRIPGGKTCYLSELQSGDGVLVVSPNGQSREAIVGRVKIERRPLLLVTAELKRGPETTSSTPLSGSIILQNAETIRLVSPQGEPVSVVELKEGDRVLVTVDMPGRHFGIAIKETISEK